MFKNQEEVEVKWSESRWIPATYIGKKEDLHCVYHHRYWEVEDDEIRKPRNIPAGWELVDITNEERTLDMKYWSTINDQWKPVAQYEDKFTDCNIYIKRKDYVGKRVKDSNSTHIITGQYGNTVCFGGMQITYDTLEKNYEIL